MTSQSEPGEIRLYFIRRHGGYFCPGAHGYTTDISHAGIFEETVARRYLQAEGVTIHTISEQRDKVLAEIAEHKAAIHGLEQTLVAIYRSAAQPENDNGA